PSTSNSAEYRGRSTGAENVLWNLDDLVSPPVSEAVDSALDAADQGMDRLAAKYRGRVAGLDAPQLSALLQEYEAIIEASGKIESFASLSWTSQSDDPACGALLQKVRERRSMLTQKAVFLEIEWAHAPEQEARQLIDDPLLSRWRHWLIISRLYKPHLLSEPEEKILAEKSVNGAQAWTRYFDETFASTLFEWDGGTVPAEVILRQLYAPDREARRRAAASLTRGLRGVQRTTTFVFNTLLAEKSSEDRLRGYPTWISSRNMENQVDDATVDALVAAVMSRYDIVARYYRLKRRLAGLDELFDYDRYAPLDAADRRFSWSEARETVLSAYARFHPRMAEIASLFFEKGWIDATVRPGKRGGAFSSS
ncbi:MAG TPA: M3 family metallopeptidase, partial [Spirochaetia bacterium]|nr:M3 family metallopeptidase [Spirochaetia bacterium]